MLAKPASIITQGGIVIFPTETVYGIGVNAFDERAVKKLYEVKQRPIEKPISLLVSDMDMIKSITKNISELEYKLMDDFFPGPLTIILEKRNNIPDIVTANTNTVGIRMPSGIIAKKLIEYANVPIATSSANISGNASGTNLECIINDFENKVDYFIDDGESTIGVASTVVKVIDGSPHILREGAISKKQIEDCLNSP
jgi:L-threonylcarbamoyladenylate synthase